MAAAMAICIDLFYTSVWATGKDAKATVIGSRFS